MPSTSFKNITDIFYKDAGADSEFDYIEQTSLAQFLRYLDTLHRGRFCDVKTTSISVQMGRLGHAQMPRSKGGPQKPPETLSRGKRAIFVKILKKKETFKF